MPVIGDRDAAHFAIVFGGDDDIEHGLQRTVAALDFGAIFEESRLHR